MLTLALRHITKKCCTEVLDILQIRHIRQFLDQKVTTKLMLCLAVSQLNYCNSILVDLPEASIKHMQNVQDIVAKIIFKAGKHNSLKAMFVQFALASDLRMNRSQTALTCSLLCTQ